MTSLIPSRTFSGVQPTGSLHLGNYLGAIKRFAALQTDAVPSLFCIVDLHAITLPQDRAALRENTRTTAAAFLAAGVDRHRSIIFAQSRVREHTELAWILNCTARVGWLERMTQFKDKAGESAERESVGLYAYPVLMAADILLYQATQVPVGADQKQHMELARDVAKRFNTDHRRAIGESLSGERDVLFPLPRAVFSDGPETRVMSLQDATRKMSKSDPNQLATIGLMDSPDTIARKVRRAQSDSEALPGRVDALIDRPAARNLVGLYAALQGLSMDTACEQTEGMRFSALKERLTEVLVAEIVPVGQAMRAYLDDPGYLDLVLQNGAERAQRIAHDTMRVVRDVVGLSG